MKNLGMTKTEITTLIEKHLFAKVRKMIQKAGGGNNVKLESINNTLTVFVCADNTEIKEFDLTDIILSGFELKFARLFSSDAIDNNINIIREYLAQSNNTYHLVPDKLNRKVNVFLKVEKGYKKVILSSIINAAFDAKK